MSYKPDLEAVEKARSVVREYLADFDPTEDLSGVAESILVLAGMIACGATIRDRSGNKKEIGSLQYIIEKGRDYSDHEVYYLCNRRKKLREILDKATIEDSEISWGVCAGLIQELGRQGDPLPPELTDFAAAVVRGKLTRPTRRGRKRKNAIRDMTIGLAIYRATQEGLLPSRSPNARHPNPCGCSVVQEVLAERGLHLDYKTIKGIWDRLGYLRD
jgi:hypothetical protein